MTVLFKIKYLVFLWVLLFFRGKVLGQQAVFAEAPTYLPSVFYKTFGQDLPIYNGRLFGGYSSNIKGTAFFNDVQREIGTIVYDGVAYKDLPLIYDIYTDELIVRNNDNLPYLLFSNRISAFTFKNYYFIRIDSNAVPTGFYQIIERGALSLFCKRQKVIKETIDGMTVERNFIVTDRFYILKNDQYYPVTSKRAFYKLVKEKKQAIAKQLRSQNLTFKKNFEDFITTGIYIYNQQP
ncbi:hypothetical protein [Niabella aquatica]